MPLALEMGWTEKQLLQENSVLYLDEMVRAYNQKQRCQQRMSRS